LRARKDSENTDAVYRVAAFQTFLSGRISTFGDTPIAILDWIPTPGFDIAPQFL
jgi:hypothetical protein